jgi:Protein of unknown function (DUF3276)
VEYGNFKRRDRDSKDQDRSSFNKDRDRNRDQRPFNRERRFDRDDRNNERDMEESVFSKKVHAGRRRTYFLDVRKTKTEDFFLTITESTRREDGGYRRHKIFLYKEDFNRFVSSLNEVINHVKTELMPDFDYEEFDRRQAEWEAQNRETDEADDNGRNEQAEDDADGDKSTRKPRAEDDDDMSW